MPCSADMVNNYDHELFIEIIKKKKKQIYSIFAGATFSNVHICIFLLPYTRTLKRYSVDLFFQEQR